MSEFTPQPPPPAAVYATPAQPEKKGFAVTALVLGIIAILGSWIPFLSIGSALIGLVGLIFGVIAVVKAVKGTAGGKVMAIIGTVLSALAIIFAIISTALGVATIDSALDDIEGEVTAVTPSERADDASDEEPPADVEDETESGDAAAEGTRENPFPVGSVISDDEIEIILGDANWDAGALITEENQFNDPAPEGTSYVLVPVTITNVASDEAFTPWIELSVFFVAADGRSFNEASVVTPDDLMDVDDLYKGGTGTGNAVFAIPTDAQEGGVWGLELGWFSDAVFVEAR